MNYNREGLPKIVYKHTLNNNKGGVDENTFHFQNEPSPGKVCIHFLEYSVYTPSKGCAALSEGNL